MLKTLDLRGVPDSEPLDLPRPDLGAEGPVEDVRAILADVRARGDAAVRDLTSRFDGVELAELRVAPEELDDALGRLDPELREALVAARDAVESFHRHRAPLPERYERDGISVDHIEVPVDRAGVYAPGGRAKYPSSVLMTAVPARVAGVGSVVCCVPPGPDGSLPVEILAAAALAGVDEVYRIGGAQAIAAMAYGTESVGKVDVIVGPGSKWVSIAQREVRGVVGVPAAFAGPSEVVVVADESAPPSWAAIDVAVQAEHGPDGLAWLVTWSEDAAREIADALERIVERSPRREETTSTLASGGHVVLVDGPAQAMRVANEIAPEHLELLVVDPDALLRLVRHAGAVFLGPLAPASVGDYMAGPSHVLPTFATARFASVLGVEDFVRRVHAVRVDRRGIQQVARHVAAIADAEGLPAHAESVRLRLGEATWSAP
ncbi:MAG: histidinol dehydrogenase [Actinomycetota bacterium]|nr:histidinol dehydrogenase [Actinomycetota bacterium]